ncbi:DUF3954 domain-containing protein [Priestia megaterium]|nr:DUF3954 domain-containing protein [Priestia megaterium]NMM59845.1 DUF3954 domain-containing protein [Priestia megaterium]QCY27402.1 DUF3954 domain-containing protein [Priestia megaterium NBRC 15308 = ATCC 14581]QSF27253.1 DUF3954 domain-containing protein [Priestia megaterium]
MRRYFLVNEDRKYIAEIDLMNNKKMYVVKDGQLIEHDLPDYGETLVITLGGKVDRLETKTKRKV